MIVLIDASVENGLICKVFFSNEDRVTIESPYKQVHAFVFLWGLILLG